MADDNKGAFWLSLEKGIRNPQFRQAMLTCGDRNSDLTIKMNSGLIEQSE